MLFSLYSRLATLAGLKSKQQDTIRSLFQTVMFGPLRRKVQVLSPRRQQLCLENIIRFVSPGVEPLHYN